METIVLVTDVPMLEPKIIGMAFLTGAPAETKATKMQKKKLKILFLVCGAYCSRCAIKLIQSFSDGNKKCLISSVHLYYLILHFLYQWCTF